MKFKYWRPDREAEDEGEVIESLISADAAAERYVERYFAEWKDPEEITISVRPLFHENGRTVEGPAQAFVVEMVAQPEFHARPLKVRG